MADDPIRYWQRLTTTEVASIASQDPVVVVPLAATEQHGPHLPLSTDLEIARGLLRTAFGRLPTDHRVWMAPPLAFGASGEHSRFPGTLSLDPDVITETICQLGAALQDAGVRRLVVFNSHGGNRGAIESAALRLRDEQTQLVVKASYTSFARPDNVQLPDVEWRHGLHGGALETAMMLYFRPELVRTNEIGRFDSLGEELEGAMRRLGPEGEAPFAWLAGDLNPLGVTGDASLADAELGQRLADHYGSVLAEVLQDAAAFPLDRLR